MSKTRSFTCCPCTQRLVEEGGGGWEGPRPGPALSAPVVPALKDLGGGCRSRTMYLQYLQKKD
jgi:hypothetical protein